MFKKGDIVMCDDEHDHMYVEVSNSTEDEFTGVVIEVIRSTFYILNEEVEFENRFFRKIFDSRTEANFKRLFNQLDELESRYGKDF